MNVTEMYNVCFLIIRFIIPVVFIIKLDWSVRICLTQLYAGRDMYTIYYIKITTCFGTLYWPSSG